MTSETLKLIEKTRRIGTWRANLETRTVSWSKSTYDIHELPHDVEMSVDDGIRFYVEEHQPIITGLIEEAIAEHKPWDVELKIKTARGNVRWVRAIGEPLFEGESVRALHGLFEDIHDRKQLEVEREETLVWLYEGERVAKLGHWKWTPEPEQIKWSPGLFHMFGLDPAKGPPSIEQHATYIHPDDRAGFDETLARAMQEATPYTVACRILVNGEVRHIRGDGVPLFDSKGNLSAFIGTSIDNTEAKHAARRIQRLNRRLTLAMDAGKVGHWEWNIKSNELVWGPQMYALYGLDEEDFDGAYSAWEQSLHPEDKAGAVLEIETAVATCSSFRSIFRVVHPKTGEVRMIRASADMQLDDSGKPETMIGLNWDITEAQALRRELERSNQELAQLAYRASHDLKAPLTTIKRLSEYIQEDIDAGELDEAKRSLAIVHRQAASLEELVSGLLDVARADLATQSRELVDLRTLAEEVIESLQSESDDRAVRVELRGAPKSQYILPKTRIYQVLTNLISNAIKYSDPVRSDRKVDVEVSEKDGQMHIVVADNGLGIPTSNQGSIYDMFRTLHASKISGSGIGMYIVKKHVDALEGSIDFDTSSAGTTFHVCFPLGERR